MSALKVGLIAGAGLLVYEYFTGGLSSLVGGASTPVSSTPVNTVPGATVSVTPKYSDTDLLHQLNVLPWNNTDYPQDQLTRIGLQIPLNYSLKDPNSGIMPGTVLAFLTGVGGAGTVGEIRNGYKWNGTWWAWNGGISGLGLGMIINLQSMFAGHVPASGFGEEEFSGLGEIVDDANNSAGYIDVGPMQEAAMFNGSKDSSTDDFYLAAMGKG